MSLQTSTWRLSRLEVPKRGVKRPLVGFRSPMALNTLNAICKLLPLQISLSSNITMGPQRWYRCKIPSMVLHLTRSKCPPILRIFFWRKMKSPSSMRNGILNTSKCRGKFQKMGVMFTHSPKMLGPSPKFQKKNKK
jgi:hypothetical protein